MKLRDLLKFNHDCNAVFIRETDGNFSRPVFKKTLTSGDIPDEILDRDVKHFQAGIRIVDSEHKECEHKACLLVNLFM